jgi:hypothetical protein
MLNLVERVRRFLIAAGGISTLAGQTVARCFSPPFPGKELVYQIEAIGIRSTTIAILTAAQQGKGTVGGLLKDPSIYEDLKLTLGKVQRNVLLKALIRAAIRGDGLKREGDAAQP